jgi:hypothetical protein
MLLELNINSHFETNECADTINNECKKKVCVEGCAFEVDDFRSSSLMAVSALKVSGNRLSCLNDVLWIVLHTTRVYFLYYMESEV